MSDVKVKIEHMIFGMKGLFNHRDDQERVSKKQKVKVGISYIKSVRDNYINIKAKYKNYLNGAIKLGIRLICKIEKYELTELYLNKRG